MLKLRKIQREFDEEPAGDLEFEEIPDLDEDLDDDIPDEPAEPDSEGFDMVKAEKNSPVDPNYNEQKSSKADSSRQTLDDVQTAEISNINNEDLPDTINNRKQTTEEET